MAKNQPIPCPECDRKKYFEGLCYFCKSRKKREHYQSLSEETIKATIDDIIIGIGTIDKWEKIYEDFSGLLAYQDINTEEIANAAFKKNIFYPPTLYRNASEEIQDELIKLLLQPHCQKADDILNCLAIIGSEKVKKAFIQLDKNPLSWRKTLYVGPAIYAESGGWTFDANGNKSQLNFDECYSLAKEEREDDAVKVAEHNPNTCSICSCQTVNILNIDGNEERLSFLDIKGRLTIPICPNCTSMCEKTIIRYTLDGESSFEIVDPFAEENNVSAESYHRLTNNHFRLSKEKEPVYYACGNDEVSTIGGTPEWIQDWQYENCPDCQKKMKQLAAISWSQIWEHSEGTLYIQICQDCSVATAFHQQT